MMEKLSITLNQHSKMNLCDQILTELRSQISLRQLQPGERLPTVREVAAQLKVNFNTVARAYRILDQEGWITTRQGRGTFVENKIELEQEDQQHLRDASVDQLIELIKAQSQRLQVATRDILQEINHRMIEEGLVNATTSPIMKTGVRKRVTRIKRSKSVFPTANHYRKPVTRKTLRSGKKPGSIR